MHRILYYNTVYLYIFQNHRILLIYLHLLIILSPKFHLLPFHNSSIFIRLDENNSCILLPNLLNIMNQARDLILKSSKSSLNLQEVRGYDFNQGINYSEIIKSFATTGLQATNLSRAIEIVNSMVFPILVILATFGRAPGARRLDSR